MDPFRPHGLSGRTNGGWNQSRDRPRPAMLELPWSTASREVVQVVVSDRVAVRADVIPATVVAVIRLDFGNLAAAFALGVERITPTHGFEHLVQGPQVLVLPRFDPGPNRHDVLMGRWSRGRFLTGADDAIPGHLALR